MIHFCLVHTAYRLHCWLPRSHRLRLHVTAFLVALACLTLQLYVLYLPRSSRYCSQPLLPNLVASIALTFLAIGFKVLLTRMEPVPGALKKLFAGFGVGSFGAGLCTTVLTVLAPDCARTTRELYYLSVLLSGSSSVATVLFSSQGLIWLAGVAWPRLNTKAGPGSWHRSPAGPASDPCLQGALLLGHMSAPLNFPPAKGTPGSAEGTVKTRLF